MAATKRTSNKNTTEKTVYAHINVEETNFVENRKLLESFQTAIIFFFTAWRSQTILWWLLECQITST
jgi:hypothetical protein